MNILKFNQIFHLEVAKLMHQISMKKPCNLSKHFVKSSQAHTRLTQTSTLNTFAIPFFKTNKLQQSFLYQGVSSWNSIPINIRTYPLPKFVKFYSRIF